MLKAPRRESKYFLHEIKYIWSWSNGDGIVGYILVGLCLSVMLLPAWVAGFILAGSGYYHYRKI